MPYTLFETLSQIDPYVQLDDGLSVATVRDRVASLEGFGEEDEYVMYVDAAGRLLIYKLDYRGRLIRPAAFVEHKSERLPGQLNATALPGAFGIRPGDSV